MEQETAASVGADEDDASNFLGVVNKSLDLAHELLIEAMREEGLDAEEGLAETEPDPIEDRREQLPSHPLVEQAEEYVRPVGRTETRLGTASRAGPDHGGSGRLP